MATSGADPHRVLGVARGATIEEIRRAYRALAKRHHPDAGQGSVARFLEIQAAYEALVGTAAPDGGRRAGRRPADVGPADGGPASRPGRRPAQGADPSRSRGTGSGAAAGGGAGAGWASRPPRQEARWTEGTTAGGSAGGPGPRDGAPTGGAPGPRDGAPTGGAPGPRDGAPTGGAPGPRGRAPRDPDDVAGGRGSSRRATFGSTTYDEAEEVFEPGWSGASWYGPTSGTYWTLNPKEYADPRKHGPEYQARGRRQAATGGDPADPEPGATDAGAARTGGARPSSGPTEAGSQRGRETRSGAGNPSPGREASSPGREPSSPGRATAGDLPPDWRGQAWTAAGPPGSTERPTFEHEPPAPEPAQAGGAPGRPPQARAARSSSAGIAHAGPTTPPADGPRIAARVVLALAGWAVPGLALAAVAGLPGGLVATLPLQAAGVAVLAFHPRLAWTAAGGGLALVFAAIPIVALVAALGGPVVPGEPMPVAVVLAALTWGGGLVAVGSGRFAPFPWRRRQGGPAAGKAGGERDVG